MARDTRSAFLRELEQVEPRMAREFERAIRDVRDTAQMRQIRAAIREGLRTGDVATAAQEVLASLSDEPGFYAGVDAVVGAAFAAGANYLASTAPPARRLRVRFNGRHPDAEQWVRQNSAELIEEIRNGNTASVRAVIDDGVSNSRSQREVARTLMGVLGLRQDQTQAVLRAREEIENMDSSVLQRERLHGNDRRSLRAAMRRGEKVPRERVEQIVQRYSDRLLRLRAQTVARTEMNAALNAGRHQMIAQLVESGEVRRESITRIWDAVDGPRTRASHAALNGQQRPWGVPYSSPVTGVSLAHPHDPNAPGYEVVNCECTERIRIDWRTAA